MSDWLATAVKITEGLVRALAMLGPPVLLTGIILLQLPLFMAEPIGIDSRIPVVATVLGIAFTIGLPPPWLKFAIGVTKRRLAPRIAYLRLSRRACLYLGPAASGYDHHLYAPSGDEDAQMLVDKDLAYVSRRGNEYMCLVFYDNGKRLVQANRARIRALWNAPKNKSQVDLIVWSIAEAEKRGGGRI